MDEPRTRNTTAPTILLVGVFLILLTAALRIAAALLFPIAVAGLLMLLLDPPVRALRKLGLPTAVGAGLMVFGTLALTVAGGAMLASPASDWIETTPAKLVQVQTKIRKMLRPIQETARKVDQATETTSTQTTPPTVQIKSPGLLQRLSVSTASIAATVLTIVFLTYFLLAMLPAFRRKLAGLIGTLAGARNIEETLTEIETQMSRYLVLNTLTGVGVGLATWAFLAAVQLPNALLWGVVAFLLNFIPYAGSLATAALVGAAALVAFDGTGRAVMVVIGSSAIHLVAGNFVTPHLMGRHLPLNPVAIFVSLLYWGWVWGPAGTLVAVPITVMLQVIFARVDRLRPIAILLDT